MSTADTCFRLGKNGVDDVQHGPVMGRELPLVGDHRYRQQCFR